ncbi:hypothetical protein [Sphingomonas sp.]|uniref:hypothetical protein n=1 Tax=Sphingomonas sp. TaxID=28214 RepID=UPI0031D498DF
MDDDIIVPSAGASAGLTGVLALACRSAPHQWPTHWRSVEPFQTIEETVDA